MITARTFGSTWLKIFASGRRAGAGAGAAAVGLGALCCCGRIRGDSGGGDSKVKRSKKTSERRFTDNSICCKLMLAEGKRLSCQLKIVQEARFRGIFLTGFQDFQNEQDRSCESCQSDNPVTAFCSQSRALFDGGLFDK